MISKGQMINGRYQIIGTIGEGGMANVYLAYDTILDRNVAVKVLRGDLAEDEKFVRRFQREAISASSLSHPNIVEMYDVGEDDSKYYIVMEYIEGKTLKSLIKRRGALTLSEAIDIMIQLTSALAHAHDSYIIHRDIKPQNILILDSGLVKITDFGIAMAMNSNELTQTNSVMGSVHYLPPEQANGNGSTIKSDIYSLGITFYELLTGKVPFKGDNAVEIAMKHIKDPIPSIRKANPDIPQSVENIILKACAKNPKNRYNNALEMHDDLKTCLDEERAKEGRITYEHPENDMEETKVLPNLKETLKNNNVNDNEEECKDFVEEKKVNKALIIIGTLLGVIILALVAIFIIYPKLATVPDVRIPEVTNLSVTEAEDKLIKEGFAVKLETKEEYNNEVEKGNVIRTEPTIGRIVKKGTEVTLVISLGSKVITIEDYTGQKYFDVKAKLEVQGLKVEVETRSLTEEEKESGKFEENNIMDQLDSKREKLEPGTELSENDVVYLIIPEIDIEYPDMIAEEWTLDEIQKFCDDNGINLVTEYKETGDEEEGTIISQSRMPGTKVTSGATLKITIAKKIEISNPENNISDEDEPSTDSGIENPDDSSVDNGDVNA